MPWTLPVIFGFRLILLHTRSGRFWGNIYTLQKVKGFKINGKYYYYKLSKIKIPFNVSLAWPDSSNLHSLSTPHTKQSFPLKALGRFSGGDSRFLGVHVDVVANFRWSTITRQKFYNSSQISLQVPLEKKPDKHATASTHRIQVHCSPLQYLVHNKETKQSQRVKEAMSISINCQAPPFLYTCHC